MATDPRLLYGYEEEDQPQLSFPGDNSLDYPVFTLQGHGGTGGTGTSASIGLAAALVNTGDTAPEVGLGAADGMLVGKIKVVEDDRSVTVQVRGWMLLPYVTGGNVPLVGSPVSVDGTGKVRVTATYRGAICMGFQPDPHSGTDLCLVKIG